MPADFLCNKCACRLWCIFSRNSRAGNNTFGKVGRGMQSSGSNIKDRTVFRKASPYIIVKRIGWNCVYQCINLMNRMVFVV